jgi:hypothetical protein
MQMLGAAGIPLAKDGSRAADTNNPNGYFELDAVTRIRENTHFLEAAVGHAIKVVAPLLVFLPAEYQYTVLFVERDLEEVLESQRVMLARSRSVGEPLGVEANSKDDVLLRAYSTLLDRAKRWIARHPHVNALWLSHSSLMRDPAAAGSSMLRFLIDEGAWCTSSGATAPEASPVSFEARVAAMARVVDPALHRQQAARDTRGTSD